MGSFRPLVFAAAPMGIRRCRLAPSLSFNILISYIYIYIYIVVTVNNIFAITITITIIMTDSVPVTYQVSVKRLPLHTKPGLRIGLRLTLRASRITLFPTPTVARRCINQASSRIPDPYQSAPSRKATPIRIFTGRRPCISSSSSQWRGITHWQHA